MEITAKELEKIGFKERSADIDGVGKGTYKLATDNFIFEIRLHPHETKFWCYGSGKSEHGTLETIGEIKTLIRMLNGELI